MEVADRADRAPLPQGHEQGWSPPYPLQTMLRIHLLQQWYGLSDPAMEDALIEVPTMRRFAGIDMISDRIPDETTILTFRHLLEKHGLGQQIFEVIKAHLKGRSPSVPEALEQGTGTGSRNASDLQGQAVQWYHRCAEGFAYGMKVPIGVDKDTGLIHSVETTAANVHDLTPAPDLLHGEETVLYADAGY
jgi:IS5 family transposase